VEFSKALPPFFRAMIDKTCAALYSADSSPSIRAAAERDWAVSVASYALFRAGNCQGRQKLSYKVAFSFVSTRKFL
jgi:hypothetical protein